MKPLGVLVIPQRMLEPCFCGLPFLPTDTRGGSQLGDALCRQPPASNARRSGQLAPARQRPVATD